MDENWLKIILDLLYVNSFFQKIKIQEEIRV